MNNLGDYYCDIEKNYPKAIEYFLMSIEKGNS
jgi:TPR repeat protein